MEIKKLFDRGENVQSRTSQSEAARKNQKAQAAYQTDQARVGAAGDDRVSISALSRQLSQISQILSDDEVKRSESVAEIKRAVEDGSYLADSKDVASSLVSFAAGTEDLA